MLAAVEWSPQALADLVQIRAHIARDQPGAAERVAMRIVALAEVLREFPKLGHKAGANGLRQLTVGGTPYSILYRFSPASVRILAVWHGRRMS